jgi:enoyl-CoA hydratase/carnithine racemase
MSDTPLKTRLGSDEQILRLTLAKPKANIIDAEMISALSAALESHAADERLMVRKDRISVLAPASRNTCRTSARRC